MPNKIIGYGRVSIDKQMDGTSPESQKRTIIKYAEFLQQKHPELTFDERAIGFDAGVTSDIFFMARKAGAAVCAMLMPGDHLIIPLFDRAFRSAADVEQFMKYAKERGINVHVLDFPCDLNTATGEMVLGIIASVKRFEKQTIRERTKRSIKQRKADGTFETRAPLGWMYSKQRVGKYRKVVPDEEYRKVAREIQHLHEVEGMTFLDIWRKFLKEKRKRPLSNNSHYKGPPREWNASQIEIAYALALLDFPRQIRWRDAIAKARIQHRPFGRKPKSSSAPSVSGSTTIHGQLIVNQPQPQPGDS